MRAVCHVVEKLWTLGHRFHQEGSAELTAWVEELKALVYGGKAAALVEHDRHGGTQSEETKRGL